MQEARNWFLSMRIKRTLDALKKNGFEAIFAKTKEDALQKVLEIIPLDAKVGIGGSITIRELGLVEQLINRGNPVIHHWNTEEVSKKTLMKEELMSDVFLSSTNALTEDGKLVNIDDTGNRVGAMTFGPNKALVIAGINKLVKNVEEGVTRVKTVVAPMNARRLNKNTPCASIGLCTDCDATNRICRVMTIIERKPQRSQIIVILVGEELGF